MAVAWLASHACVTPVLCSIFKRQMG
jgi:hypothetical protein